MNRYIKGTASSLAIILTSVSLLTACNTVKDSANGIEQTAAGVGHTITGAVVGAEQDVKATKKAITAHRKAPVHKAHKKVAHKAVHHKTAAVKKVEAPAEVNKPVEASDENVTVDQ